MSIKQLTQMSVKHEVTEGYKCYCNRPSAFAVEVPTTERSSFLMYLCETHVHELEMRITRAISSAK